MAGKQRVLETTDLSERLRLVLAQITKEGDALEIETEIKEKVQTEMGRTQREYMLRQQLEAIRRELGEAEDAEEGVDELRGRIEAAEGSPRRPRSRPTGSWSGWPRRRRRPPSTA